MEGELRKLIAKRAGIKHKLTNFAKFLDPIKTEFNINVKNINELQLTELNTRYETILNLDREFEEVHIEINSYDPDNINFTELDEFMDKFSSHISMARFILNKLSEDRISVVSHHSSNHEGNVTSLGDVSQSVKLPTINLPKFKGSYDTWLEFKDTFISLIHNNSAINNIQKYHYLRASLEGEAIKVIQALEISADNYNTAWDLLRNRYDNKKLLINNHLKALFNMENVKKDSSASLRTMSDIVYTNLRALTTLKQPIEHWDTIIIYLVTSKFDNASTREWEHCKANNEFPTLHDLNSFLKTRADFLESMELKYNQQHTITHKSTKSTNYRQTAFFATKQFTCKVCSQSHAIYNCEEFKKLDISHRIIKVKELRLCTNCLRSGHFNINCTARSCTKCTKKHNTLLHESEQTQTVPAAAAEQNISMSNVNQQSNQHVLLSTVSIKIRDNTGSYQKCRALLDSGSQSNFISLSLSNRISAKQQNVNISVIGINNISSTLNKKCDVTIQSSDGKFTTKLTCLIIPTITDNIPASHFEIESWKIPNNINLADPNFNQSNEVDLLIGAGLFWNIVKGNQIHLGKNMPILQNTNFGWVVAGPINNQAIRTFCNFSKNIEGQSDLQKFWELEEVRGDKLPLTQDDKICEDHFIHHLQKTEEGRLMVRLPLKHEATHLGDSQATATKRLLNLEYKLSKTPKLKNQYIEFMREYEHLNHMSKRNTSEPNSLYYFLPHHAVIRQCSLTTKLRVVFDGSAPSQSGWSLNDIQYKGPAIQNDILDILLRFRQHAYVIAADIEKMYRQILVHPDDRALQCILWRSSPEEPISVYSLNTVTYGTTSAPYLAIRCIKQIAKEAQANYADAAKIIDQDFYVDDLITGFNSAEEAIHICQQIKMLLQNACFKLRKWISNDSLILQHLQDDNEPISTLSLGDNEQTKTLGIQWMPCLDVLTYHIKETDHSTEISKRSILSDTAKLYDPLGLVSPCIIVAKIMIQQLWLLKIDWDDPVPEQLQQKWLQLRDNLFYLNKLQINRHAICRNAFNIQLHGFCDASTKAYGACIYLRSTDAMNQTHINLLCAKTKVAPVKTQSIPRLELCSALMLARLVKKVTASLTFHVPCHLWSDSQIVLCWIQTQPSLLQSFVANRIVEIQTLTNINDWRYVNTKDNPADLSSRGTYPQFLVQNMLWWHGPSWLHESEPEWPAKMPSVSASKLPELKKVKQSTILMSTQDVDLFNRFSSMNKLKRTVAYCFRFIHNTRTKDIRLSGELSVLELERALEYLVKLSQKESFANEIQLITNNKDSKHKLQALTPFIDENNVLRVGGRLKHSSLDFNSKHPILLSGKHKLTQLIFEEQHVKLLHAGPQLLLSTVRQTFWPTSGMNIAKVVVRKCITCFRFKPKGITPQMADLPKQRVTVTQPFHTTGVDYAGPFLLKDKKGRGWKPIKGYICLFICFASKALHLELVTDLTTETFIASLRRFCARRGKPTHIYSDNGTNFVGAQKELKLLQELFSKNEVIKNFCTTQNITWHFIPPNSPHFGGLWESGVKGVKHHLRRAIGDTNLIYEEFLTILVQIESILNSRPLFAMSSDPNDLEPITPSHFLIGKSLITIPDPNLSNVKTNTLSRYQLLQQINQSFWDRWSKEYLSSLQQRKRWQHNEPNLNVGSLVLIKQDNLPSCHWLLGRVISVHPGDDGIVRVATVQTSKGTLKRSVTKLCPLPVPEDSESECNHGQFSASVSDKNAQEN